MVGRFEGAHLLLDAEQRREEVLEVRRDGDQEIAFRPIAQQCGISACLGELRRQRRVRGREVRDEQAVEGLRACGRVEVGELKPVGKS